MLADARLQGIIAGLARATVTSLAGLGAELDAVCLYLYAVGSRVASAPELVAVLAVPLLITGLLVPRWLPVGPAAEHPG